MQRIALDKELRKQNENLAPIRDDLADWFNEILGTNIEGPDLFHQLQVCLQATERQGETETDRQTDGQTDRQSESVCVCV